MGVVGVLGLLIGSFAILSASVSSESSPPEYSAADREAPVVVLEVKRLKKQTARLMGKLEEVVGVSVEEKKAKEDATLRRPIEVTTKNASTALGLNAPAWELGGQTEFNVSQVMGVWRMIELFENDHRPSLDPCQEYIFNLRGSTVEQTWRWGKSGDKDEREDDLTVDTQSPHQWILSGFGYTWLKTDYDNWAVLLLCSDEGLSSCTTLLILSRERTLPPATLEMLRDVDEQRGFPKSNRDLVDQASC